MKLILSQYIRTLKERNELDVLIPDLLSAMGILPIYKPQTGTRQYGVDIPAVGVDPEDGREKLFLFVLKQGDIGRSIWDSGVQSVRQSLNDIFDVYLRSHVAPEHQNLPRKVILGTSGDLKEEVNANWVGYAHDNVSKAEFEFWGADEIAIRLERHMLDEHLFTQEDRSDLRRALALIGEIDYEMQDFHRLLLRQLGLNRKGELLDGGKLPKKQLIKAFTQVNLSTKILARWAISDGNTKNALFAVERALLWSWHRVQLED